jgi:ATP-dependent Clp protease ATP-binding subunit ClpA
VSGPTTDNIPQRPRRRTQPYGILDRLSSKIIGQPHAMEPIASCVRMFEAGLNPDGRPAGVFLLLGPTGTGKTRSVEALAEVLHGSRKHMLRIDCGEYQMEHEVAKLIGAPPGYLGHRETHPVLTQARLASITSQNSGISIVLFDEVEKAAPSLHRMLLGVLDKATLRLGDNNVVNFERTLIFMTSNVGARGIQDALSGGYGLAATMPRESYPAARLESIAMNAARRTFAPEFINRLDAVITYQPLSERHLEEILDVQLRELQEHIENRLGPRGFRLKVTSRGRKFLLRKGTSAAYGAREIRRALHQHVTQPLSVMVTEGEIEPGGTVKVDKSGSRDYLLLKAA